MSFEDTVPFYQNPNLCQLLLSQIATGNTLQVRESQTTGAGSGLFTDNAVPAGEEVFRSKPVVTCVQDTLSTVCDFCYTNNASKVLPEGRFRTRRDPIEALVECNGCHICKYCTEVKLGPQQLPCRANTHSIFLPPQSHAATWRSRHTTNTSVRPS